MLVNIREEFWSADWSPRRALRRLRRDWPDLNVALYPDYEEGAAEAEAVDAGGPRRFPDRLG